MITVAVDAVVDDENVTIKTCHFDRGGVGGRRHYQDRWFFLWIESIHVTFAKHMFSVAFKSTSR